MNQLITPHEIIHLNRTTLYIQITKPKFQYSTIPSIIHFSYIYLFFIKPLVYTPQRMSQCKKCDQPCQCSLMHPILCIWWIFLHFKKLQNQFHIHSLRLRKIYSTLKFQLHNTFSEFFSWKSQKPYFSNYQRLDKLKKKAM